MERRKFLKLSLYTSVATMLNPTILLAPTKQIGPTINNAPSEWYIFLEQNLSKHVQDIMFGDDNL